MTKSSLVDVTRLLSSRRVGKGTGKDGFEQDSASNNAGRLFEVELDIGQIACVALERVSCVRIV